MAKKKQAAKGLVPAVKRAPVRPKGPQDVGMLGERVRLVRLERAWSQMQLAQAASIPLSNLSMVENGHKDLTVATAKRLATALGVSLDYLAGLSSQKSPR